MQKMVKKDDYLWISLVGIFNIIFWIVFFGTVVGIWNDTIKDYNVVSFLLKWALLILNMSSINMILFHKYPDGSKILPIPENAGRGILIICLIGLGIEQYVKSKIETPKWIELMPDMVISVSFFFLIILFGIQMQKQKKIGQKTSNKK